MVTLSRQFLSPEAQQAQKRTPEVAKDIAS